jgi:hypothetical protein
MSSDAAFIRPGAFEVTVRPARAVYLVDATPGADRSGARRAIQEASTRWGGACEPIVLAAPDGAIEPGFRDMVDLSRVDAAMNVNLPDERAREIADALGLPLVALRWIDNAGIAVNTCHPECVGEQRTVDGSNGFVMARRDGKLWEAAAAGDLTDGHEATLRSGRLVVRRPAVGNDEIGRAQLWPRYTLAARTLFEFGQNHASPVPGSHPTVLWITRDDDVRDSVEFWNLRALRSVSFGAMPMFLLPEDEVEHWVGFATQLRAALGDRLDEFNPDVILTSRSVPPEALGAFAERLGLVPGPDEPDLAAPGTGQPTVRTEPYTYRIATQLTSWCAFTRSYGHKTQLFAPVYGQHASLEFPSPVPFTGPGRTLLAIAGPTMAALPRRAEIAKLIHPDAIWRDNGAQITASATASFRVPVAVPSLTNATLALLKQATARWALSDKGAIGAGLRAEADLEVLLEPGVFEALLALTTPRSRHMAKELAKASNKTVAELSTAELELAERWSGRAERQFRSPSTLSVPGLNPAGAQAALERLAEIGWAHRGLQITCPACKLDSFLPLSEQYATGPARCPGCASPAAFSRTGATTTVAYRLDSRIDRASDQGVIPHLLTTAALARRFNEAHLLPGVDVWFETEEQKKEVDLYGICDAKVVAGEVKQSGTQFTAEQVEGDIAKSARLGVDLHIMASPGQIPRPAHILAHELCAKYGLEVLILQKAELRPTDTPLPD